MIKTLSVIFILFLVPVSGYAQDLGKPHHTLFVNDIKTVNIIDSFMVSVTSQTVSLFKYDEQTKQYQHLEGIYVKIDPSETKRCDSLLVIKDFNNRLHLINISRLPDLEYLGSMSYDFSFDDFVIDGNNLYLAAYYEGVYQYDITDIDYPVFADSSMKGIVVTKLGLENDTLYALDEYNGLLRYDLANGDLNQFIDYLYIPLRAKGFVKIDTTFYFNINDKQVLIGMFDQSGSGIIDSLPIDFIPIESIYSDSLLLYLTNRKFTMVNTNDGNSQRLFQINNTNTLLGDMKLSNEEQFLVLPEINGGATMFDLIDIFNTYQGVDIYDFNDYLLWDRKIFISSGVAPIDVINISDTLVFNHDYTIYDVFDRSTSIGRSGDSLLVAYPQFNEVAIIQDANVEDDYFLENSFYAGEENIDDIKFISDRIHENQLFMLYRWYGVDLYRVDDTGYIHFANQWLGFKNLDQAIVVDTNLITIDDNYLKIYAINQDFELVDFDSHYFKSKLETFAFKDNLLYLFSRNTIYIVDIADLNSINRLGELGVSRQILDVEVYGDSLYAVGEEGIFIFDVSNLISPLEIFSNVGGNDLQVDDDIILVSDNYSLMVFYTANYKDDTPSRIETDNDKNALSTNIANYPNPFNQETVIKYSLPYNAKVSLSIYNILGQQVKELINGSQEAGEHYISWDGTGNDGEVVSTGVYLFRLSFDDYRQTRKMIFIK